MEPIVERGVHRSGVDIVSAGQFRSSRVVG